MERIPEDAGRVRFAPDRAGGAPGRNSSEAAGLLPVDKAYVSPLKRAMDTAQLLVGGRGLEMTADKRLSEASLGAFGGPDHRTGPGALSGAGLKLPPPSRALPPGGRRGGFSPGSGPGGGFLTTWPGGSGATCWWWPTPWCCASPAGADGPSPGSADGYLGAQLLLLRGGV